MTSPALVAVTTRAPRVVLDSVWGNEVLTAHPFAVLLAAAYVTAPPPDPPLNVNGKGVRNVPEVDSSVSGTCATFWAKDASTAPIVHLVIRASGPATPRWSVRGQTSKPPRVVVGGIFSMAGLLAPAAR